MTLKHSQIVLVNIILKVPFVKIKQREIFEEKIDPSKRQYISGWNNLTDPQKNQISSCIALILTFVTLFYKWL